MVANITFWVRGNSNCVTFVPEAEDVRLASEETVCVSADEDVLSVLMKKVRESVSCEAVLWAGAERVRE